MIIFRTNKAVEELISYRKISIDVIWWSYEGFKIPNSAIIQEGDLFYVVRNGIGYNDKILVNIKKQNENYAIVASYTPQELIEKGFSENDEFYRKSLNLYDEIVISN